MPHEQSYLPPLFILRPGTRTRTRTRGAGITLLLDFISEMANDETRIVYCTRLGFYEYVFQLFVAVVAAINQRLCRASLQHLYSGALSLLTSVLISIEFRPELQL